MILQNMIEKGDTVGIYPYGRDAFDIVLALLGLGISYKDIVCVSPVGRALSGKDAGQKIGMRSRVTVTDDEAVLEDCNCIVIPYQVPPAVDGSFRKQLLAELRRYLLQEIKICCLMPLTAEEERYLWDSRTDIQKFLWYDKTSLSKQRRETEYTQIVKDIQTPVFIINDLFGNASSSTVFYLILQALKKMKYRVAAIGDEPGSKMFCDHMYPQCFYDENTTAQQMVYELRELLWDIEQRDQPDVILLHCPWPMERTLDFTMGFGFLPFIVTRAAAVDYVITCVPHSAHITKEFVDELVQDAYHRYGYDLSAICVSNIELDSEMSIEMLYPYYNYLDRKKQPVLIDEDCEIPVVELQDVEEAVHFLNEEVF